MHSNTNGGAKSHLNISNRLALRLTQLSGAAICGAMTLAVLSVLLIARPAHAQTENVLYNFTGTPDGLNPTSRLTLNGGNFYGTTYNGGLYGNGSVFKLTPNGSGGWTETLLYSFCPAAPSCTDGQNPAYSYIMFDSQGNLYGTAYNGGAHGLGAVFELSPSGPNWIETVLYSFANAPDGANPINGLIMDKAGNLYGTTFAGGAAGGNGTVFEMVPSAGGWTEQPIYAINSNGAGLTMDALGNIFGATYSTLFELVANGSGGFNPRVIYTFVPASASKQGSDPVGTPVLDSAGNIYGTTLSGGSNGFGVAYKLVRGTKSYTEKILANFGAKLGENPAATVVFDSAGNIYGTTKQGGQKGAGTVYELVAKTGYYAPVVLWNFNGENGAEPFGSLILDSAGYVYGTTYTGGSSGDGSVFVVNPHAVVTTTTLTSSVNPSASGQAVTFTATVTSSAGAPPDGDIVVFEPIGQAALVGGVATYTTSAIKVGTTNITAVYQGDLNFIKSRSNTVAQVVHQ